MTIFAKRVTLFALAVVLVASLGAAETYRVTLANGREIITRYEPQEASWDSNYMMVLTEHGNWIALERADMKNVVAETELLGFGKVIDTTTIEIGYLSNDAPTPEDTSDMSAADVLRNYLNALDRPQPIYDQRQFVSPNEVGGGIPLGFASSTGGTTGALGFGAPPPTVPLN